VRSPAILLPPSEGKAPGGTGAPWRPGRAALAGLDDARVEVLGALAATGDEGVAVATARTRPAIDRYTGVLYQHLAWGSLPPPARRRGAGAVLIASGLWGVSAPRDPLPPYRLKMGASLPGLGKLSTWWRPRLTAALAERLAGRVVWDLLPAEHAAGWAPAAVPYARRVVVRFVDAEGRTVSHWNKLLKGALVRHLLTEAPRGPEGLRDWAHPSGYRFDDRASDLGGDPALVVLAATGPTTPVPPPGGAGGRSGSLGAVG
jgi:hypothetical protein